MFIAGKGRGLENDLNVGRVEKLSKKKATSATKSDRKSDW
jgi:hypothetical protein